MWQKLDKLREQPKRKRETYALVTAISVTSVITLVWAVSLYVSFVHSDGSQPGLETAAPIFSSFFSGAKKQLDNLSAGLDELNRNISSSTASTTNATASSTTLADEDEFSTVFAISSSSTGMTSADVDPETPPPGRATGREVRIATSGNASSSAKSE